MRYTRLVSVVPLPIVNCHLRTGSLVLSLCETHGALSEHDCTSAPAASKIEVRQTEAFYASDCKECTANATHEVIIIEEPP